MKRKQKNRDYQNQMIEPLTNNHPPHKLSPFSFNKTTLLHLLIITVLCLIAYSNSFKNPFIFDDSIIIKNPYVVEPSELLKKPTDPIVKDRYLQFLSRPTVYITFALNYKIHNFTPFGFHVFNFLIHLLTSFIVYLITISLFKTPVLKNHTLSGKSPLIALTATLIFALHPIQTQAITYITQRFTCLATLFYLLSFLLYILYRLRSIESNRLFPDKKSICLFLGVLLSAILAYKSKEIAYTLPFSLIIFDIAFFKDNIKRRAIIFSSLLFTLLTYPLTLLLMKYLTPSETTTLYSSIRATGEYTGLSRFNYMITEWVVLVKYLRLLLIPIGQSIVHPQQIYNNLFDPDVIFSFIFLLLLFLLALYLIKTSKKSEILSPFMIIGFSIIWFFITLSIESTIIPLYPIYEHRLYLPSSLFFIGLSVVFYAIHNRFFKQTSLKPFAIALGIIVCLLITATILRNNVYSSHKAFWSDAKEKAIGKHGNRLALILLNLGEAYIAEGLYDEALNEFTTAIQINPQLSPLYGAIGRVYLKKGNYDKAIEYTKKTLQLEPTLAEAHLNLAEAYYKNGKPLLAISHLETALTSLPTNPNIYQFLGYLYTSTGRHDDAVKLFQRGIKLNSKEPVLYYNLGVSYASKGMFKEAIKPYEDAIALKPDYAEAYNNLGYAYAMLKQYDKAIDNFKLAIQYKSPYPEAEKNLALAQRLKNTITIQIP